MSEEDKSPEKPFDVWGEEGKVAGWSEPRVHEVKETNLSKGKHYWEMEDVRKRSIVCTSCEVRHGGVLEAHLLTHYELKNGVLYFKKKALNKTP